MKVKFGKAQETEQEMNGRVVKQTYHYVYGETSCKDPIDLGYIQGKSEAGLKSRIFYRFVPLRNKDSFGTEFFSSYYVREVKERIKDFYESRDE